MKRESMVFYASWWEAIKNLPREVQGDVLTAIIEYGLTGATTEPLKPITKALLTMVAPQIDANNIRFENGKRGGRPKAGIGEEPNENQNVTKPKPNENQTETKEKPNNNQTETKAEPNVYVYDNVIKKETSTNVEAKKEGKDAARAATLTRKNGFYDSLVEYVDLYGKDMIRDFFDYWSELNKSQTKMRWEQQPTWELSKRLATWAKRENNYGAKQCNRTATASSKQEANEYALRRFAERVESLDSE